MVVACLSLAVSLGGVGWAASSLPKNSVGEVQIKRNAITSPKVKNGSLLAADFKGGQLPAGSQGPAGEQGAAGPAGPKGDKGDPGATGASGVSGYEVVLSSKVVNNVSLADHTAVCPAGKKALGGGATSNALSALNGPFLALSRPLPDGSGWQAVSARTVAGSWQHIVFVVCGIIQ
jgi:hypothetical protein